MARFRGDSSTEATWEEINKLKAENARLLDKLNKYKTEDMENELYDTRNIYYCYGKKCDDRGCEYCEYDAKPCDGENTGLFQ
jgi:hypothetical protein